jgi:signal transduction histidine kinase
MESGTTVLQDEMFELAECVSETIQLFSLQLLEREQELEIRCEIDPGLPTIIIGDEKRLRQILLNLVGNSVKFTDQGVIQVSVRQLAKTSSTIELEFTVKDTGIGIPAAYISGLFQPYYQPDSSLSHKHGGTGLGLAICKKLVEMMGGTIRVVPGVEPGATFVFTIQVGYMDVV